MLCNANIMRKKRDTFIDINTNVYNYKYNQIRIYFQIEFE